MSGTTHSELKQLFNLLVQHYVSVIMGQPLTVVSGLLWLTYFSWASGSSSSSPSRTEKKRLSYDERRWIFDKLVKLTPSNIHALCENSRSLSVPTLAGMLERNTPVFIRWAVPLFVVTGPRSPAGEGGWMNDSPSRADRPESPLGTSSVDAVYSGFRTRGTGINISMVYHVRKPLMVLLRNEYLSIYHYVADFHGAVKIVLDRFPQFDGAEILQNTFYQNGLDGFIITDNPSIHLPIPPAHIPRYIERTLMEKRKTTIDSTIFPVFVPFSTTYHLWRGIVITWTIKIDYKQISVRDFHWLLWRYFEPVVAQVTDVLPTAADLNFGHVPRTIPVSILNTIEENFPVEGLSLYLPPSVLRSHFLKVRREAGVFAATPVPTASLS